MATMMKNTGFILANEIDKIRFKRLEYNIEKQNVKNVKVTNQDGRNIHKIIENGFKFDKVLVDVPCSGEGRFDINDKKSYSNWSLKMVEELSKLQKELLNEAIDICKTGGEIVYSTCTLNNEENEKIVDYAIKNKNIELENIDIDTEIKIAKVNGITKNVDKSIEKAIKILPSKFTEGFFIAKLKKVGEK